MNFLSLNIYREAIERHLSLSALPAVQIHNWEPKSRCLWDWAGARETGHLHVTTGLVGRQPSIFPMASGIPGARSSEGHFRGVIGQFLKHLLLRRVESLSALPSSAGCCCVQALG